MCVKTSRDQPIIKGLNFLRDLWLRVTERKRYRILPLCFQTFLNIQTDSRSDSIETVSVCKEWGEGGGGKGELIAVVLLFY